MYSELLQPCDENTIKYMYYECQDELDDESKAYLEFIIKRAEYSKKIKELTDENEKLVTEIQERRALLKKYKEKYGEI